MKKALVILSAALLLAMLAIPAFAEFELTDFVIPDTGVHFAFDGNANDEFGNLNGELVGDPTFMAGRDGTENGAIYFDDDTQYVGLYKRVALGDYTASFWVWLEDNPSYNFLCTSMEGSLRAMQNPTQVVGSTINGVVDNNSAYTAPIETWTMLTFVYEAASETTNIYANGEYVDSLFGALALPLTTIGNECAEQKGWQTYPFQALDDTWFFGRMLSEDEIKTLYTTNSVGAAPAAEPLEGNATIIWDFGADEAMSAQMGANSAAASVTYFGEEDYYVFTATGSDPYVSVDTPADSVDLVKYAKVRVKNPSQATAIELFGATDGRGLCGSECTHFEIAPNYDEWATYIIYIPDENVKTVNAYKDPQYAITEPYWAGAVNWIRLDPMWHEGDDGNDAGGSCEVGDEIYIDYIAFFANEEDAKAFRADQDAAPVVAEEVVEEAPVVEEPEVVEEVVVEEPEVVEAPAAEEAVEEAPAADAPQTFDFAIIAVVSAIVSAAGYAVSKKH